MRSPGTTEPVIQAIEMQRFCLTSRTAGRRGAALVIALICLLLVGVLGATLARTAVMQHEQVQQEVLQVQAEWLAESGVDRAVLRLRDDETYQREEWLPAAGGSGEPLGRVTIEVLASDGETDGGSRSIRVVADVPHDSEQRARVSRSLIVTVPAVDAATQ